MNLYTTLSSGPGARDATALSARLSVWHDAMVAHERRLRAGTTNDACGDECPHAEARALWSEAVAAFGVRARELTFLRSRAADPYRSVSTAGSPHARSESTQDAHPRPPLSRVDTTTTPSVASATVAAEL